MIGKAVYARIGATAPTYPLRMPQDQALPAAVYRVLATERIHLMGSDSPVVRSRVSIDLWADTYPASLTLADAVRTQMARFRGDAGGVTVYDCTEESYLEVFDDDAYRVTIDFYIYYD